MKEAVGVTTFPSVISLELESTRYWEATMAFKDWNFPCLESLSLGDSAFPAFGLSTLTCLNLRIDGKAQTLIDLVRSLSKTPFRS